MKKWGPSTIVRLKSEALGRETLFLFFFFFVGGYYGHDCLYEKS